MNNPRIPITDEQKRQFVNEGYIILPSVISPQDLENLRLECDRFVDLIHEEMDRAGTDTFGITHRNKRYFLKDTASRSEKIANFVLGDLMADVCRATIGGEAFFFLDQYVLKAADVGMKFAWHQDSGYIGYPHCEYLTCWCALDDVDEANGTVYVMPYSEAGGGEYVVHKKEAGSNDMVGYFGDKSGIPAVIPAGSMVVFSSHTFHRSGPNNTSRMRRAFIAQYTKEPLYDADGRHLWHRAERFLEGGKKVWDGSFGSPKAKTNG